MNGIARSVIRLPSLKNLVKPGKLSAANAQTGRSLWSQVQQQPPKVLTASSSLVGTREQRPCTCLSCRFAHTKAEKELVEFLAEEIVAEKKAQKLKTIPTEIKDFKVSLNGAEVTLTKTTSTERITISFNINHTVDSESSSEVESNDDKGDVGEIKSKPSFEIDIRRGNQTLSFGCSFNSEPGASGMDDSYSDIFGIDEITLYEGEHVETVYSVAGEIIDGYLYDLLMNYLEEKGISNEFAEQMVELSTNYEHTAYIGLLEGLSKFTTK
ncbi:PREDICTED: complement component 1 Q subcomponent-binding protein, mitochondrial [Ceratosolen solmsi marchali]|uniref:Complement component 1 Q subcomponent-binding protein, mitochondrial n=1 Tax=Ceratosolen solmsi marchali TaxID=326594 RepID=A0AAJ7DZF5_9HYME|nr:PREDICTED: complement component 1 Q subcomponent-binding protein, mitochondrial [Ceratosolen solmsi marchali]